jgi:hypothetical protein
MLFDCALYCCSHRRFVPRTKATILIGPDGASRVTGGRWGFLRAVARCVVLLPTAPAFSLDTFASLICLVSSQTPASWMTFCMCWLGVGGAAPEVWIVFMSAACSCRSFPLPFCL